MFSRSQQILLKRAQREADLADEEYRDALQVVTGFRSSKEPSLTNRNFDKALAYFEAIYFHKVDAKELQPASGATAVFRQRGFWASKNSRFENSRDRFRNFNLGQSIATLETELSNFGLGQNYCEGIRKTTTNGRVDEHALYLYRAGLMRTLETKKRSAGVLNL
jgi:hypothetical protein